MSERVVAGLLSLSVWVGNRAPRVLHMPVCCKLLHYVLRGARDNYLIKINERNERSDEVDFKEGCGLRCL